MPIFYSFGPGDRSVVSCRWNQPHFQKVQEINDQYINSDSYTLSQCKPPCYLINRSGLFCIQTARRSIFMQFANLQFQICKMPHHIAPWASARVLITAMSLISWNDFSSSPCLAEATTRIATLAAWQRCSVDMINFINNTLLTEFVINPFNSRELNSLIYNLSTGE